jgi:stearoyl-CoA 9-desaturase NADPH oxidoreductase
MPTAAPARSLTPTPVRRLGRRVLGSSLVDVLTAPHGVDRYLELVRPAWSLQDARAEVVEARHHASSVTLSLRPNENWAGFSAGQFIRLTVEIDGVRHSRCYSPACSQYEPGHLELTIKAHPEGLVSRFLHRRARGGAVVGLSEADGDFVLPADRPERLLLISGGSGITPVMSMLRTLCDEGHDGAVTFVHYAPRPEDVVYRDALGEIVARRPNLRVAVVCTRAGGEHLSSEQLDHLVPDAAAAETYVCGPPGLIETARRIWTESGAEKRLHVESFLPPSIALPAGGAKGSVIFARAGEQVKNSGRPLLEQAERAGLRPQYGCRKGICRTCTCRKTAGSVRNVVTGAISGAEAEDVQICVSVPVGDVELDL